MQVFKFNLSKIFNTLLFILISVMLTAQLALTTPNMRNFLSIIDKEESIYVSNGENSSRLAEITLSVTGITDCSKIKVLQNGEPIATFFENEIKVVVADNSVIEIDGSKVKTPFSVNLTNFSDNIKIALPQRIDVNSEIAILGRIFVK